MKYFLNIHLKPDTNIKKKLDKAIFKSSALKLVFENFRVFFFEDLTKSM